MSKLHRILAPDDTAGTGPVIGEVSEHLINLFPNHFNVTERPYICDNHDYREEIFPVFGESCPEMKVLGFATYQAKQYGVFTNRKISFQSTHIFLYRHCGGYLQTLISKRAKNVRYGGMLDISVAGYINAEDLIRAHTPEMTQISMQNIRDLIQSNSIKMFSNIDVFKLGGVREMSEELEINENLNIIHIPKRYNKGWTQAFMARCNTDAIPRMTQNGIAEVTSTHWIYNAWYLRSSQLHEGNDPNQHPDLKKYTPHARYAIKRYLNLADSGEIQFV